VDTAAGRRKKLFEMFGEEPNETLDIDHLYEQYKSEVAEADAPPSISIGSAVAPYFKKLLFRGTLSGKISFSFKSKKLLFTVRSSVPQDDEVVGWGYSWLVPQIQSISLFSDEGREIFLYLTKTKQDLDDIEAFVRDMPYILFTRLFAYQQYLDAVLVGMMAFPNIEHVTESKYYWSLMGSFASITVHPTSHFSFMPSEFTPLQEGFMSIMKLTEMNNFKLDAYELAGLANPFGGGELLNWVHETKAKNNTGVSDQHVRYRDLYNTLEAFIKGEEDSHDKIIVWQEAEHSAQAKVDEEKKSIAEVERKTEIEKLRVEGKLYPHIGVSFDE